MTNKSKSLRSILLKEDILSGTNYIDWYRKLKIDLKSEETLDVLTDSEIKEPAEDAYQEDLDLYERYKKDSVDVECLMLSAMKTAPNKKQNKRQRGTALNKKARWTRNCSIFLEKKKTEASPSDIFIIECNFSSSTSWILDSGCSSHICMDLQGLSNQRKLLPGEVDLRAANGAKIAALSVGSYSIKLPNDCFLVINPCYYVQVCNKNIVSVSSWTTDTMFVSVIIHDIFILEIVYMHVVNLIMDCIR